MRGVFYLRSLVSGQAAATESAKLRRFTLR